MAKNEKWDEKQNNLQKPLVASKLHIHLRLFCFPSDVTLKTQYWLDTAWQQPCQFQVQSSIPIVADVSDPFTPSCLRFSRLLFTVLFWFWCVIDVWIQIFLNNFWSSDHIGLCKCSFSPQLYPPLVMVTNVRATCIQHSGCINVE